MTAMTPERLAEVAAGWRRGLDVDELANPAGPLFGEDEFTPYEITMTGSGVVTECTVLSGSFDYGGGICYCCRIEP